MRTLLAAATAAVLVAGCAGVAPRTPRVPTFPPSPGARETFNAADPIHAIKHVIVVMQENRSFDSYFGTYPGANGIPMNNGASVACLAAAASASTTTSASPTCVAPYHDSRDVNVGGPHGMGDASADIDHGAMDGFVREAQIGAAATCVGTFDPACGSGSDVMGYHDGGDIPNYWAYAHNFVLQDAMFESVKSWSAPSHLYLVSEWSATCSTAGDPQSCKSEPQTPQVLHEEQPDSSRVRPDYAWTDLTWLLHQQGVSWAYYVASGTQPDCYNDDEVCDARPQSATTPQIWNPLPYFDDVHQDGELANVQPLDNFYAAAADDSLPSVSWIVPNGRDSEHPPARISDGQTYVTTLINSVMNSVAWSSTAIFLAWDDWGGFYDHVVPPAVDGAGFGLRVPGLVISAYAKHGYVDDQTLSFDAYTKFIEDDFLGSARIDPTTDGRPDPRPDVRENYPLLGDLRSDFDFSSPPRPPLVLPEQPTTDLQ